MRQHPPIEVTLKFHGAWANVIHALELDPTTDAWLIYCRSAGLRNTKDNHFMRAKRKQFGSILGLLVSNGIVPKPQKNAWLT